ncbi:MAG: type VI secretion system baseplate subunit TssG, partial [Acidobacteriota bacterium]|nr:type VI secretion system baseplate subunit TssG [Acidobacteriota bacterium]
MDASGRGEGAALAQFELENALMDNPNAFGFFQAVRVLERLLPERRSVGEFAEPAAEVVRFSVPPVLTFPASEIQSLTMVPDEPAGMAVNFMGLSGPQGVLPYYYTVLVGERSRAGDQALGDFLDIFSHRMISLFYRAWGKYRFAITDERGKQDRLTEHLLDIVGIGTSGFQDLLAVRDHSLVFYAGLLGPQQRPAVALQQLLEDYYGIDVEVEQFVGGWYSLAESTQCSVGDEVDASTQLGMGAVVGDEVWDQQARVRIKLGPLTRKQFDQFLPTGSAYESLRALTRFFSGDQFDFEIQLVLARDDVPACVLGADDESALPL